jgi:threonine aldolase
VGRLGEVLSRVEIVFLTNDLKMTRFFLTGMTLSFCFCQLFSISISSRKPIDLRSDTVTRPSPAMRTAMFEAEVGDDVFGDDPTVHRLENKLSTLFEKESALFFPSGTMSNLAATMSWCGKRGSEMILGDSSHMFLYEQGGVSQIAGVLPRTIPNQRDGTINLDSIEKAVRQNNIHFPVTELIALEDTHNFCGGRVLPKGYLEAVSTLAKSRDIAVHLDGARIWNAAAASKTSLAEITKGADSISVCLSKGLGAPSGSVLLGPKDFIEKARRCRKALGGGMRQVGILAAAGLQAISDFEAGILIPDHHKARLLANAIAGISGFSVALDAVETNIVLVNVEGDGGDPTTVAAMLKERGVLALPFGVGSVRLVTHRDILEEDIDVVVTAFKDIGAEIWPPLVVAAEEVESSSAHAIDAIDESVESSVPLVEVTDPVVKIVRSRRLITKVLKNEDIFRSDLTMSEYKFFVDAAQGLKVSPGDVVIRMGDSAEFFYIIESGRVDFYLESNGEYTNVVKSLSSGGFFGEIALMYDAPRAATVIASEETVLWRIHKNDFFAIQKDPDNKLGYFKTMDYADFDADIDDISDSEEEVIAEIVNIDRRLSVADAQAEASRTSGNSDLALASSGSKNKDDEEALFVSEPESFETWEEEELQGLESGGQAVSLTEDEEYELSLIVDDIVEHEVEEDPSEYYEEAVIHGMSLSDDGFCVLLKGVVCDRILRVLVTPSDPMADGLDIDQVETSEAVTLLQLLQGIDVESVLARDALAVKFAESGPGKQQYVLQRVMVDGVSTTKTFHARLLGSAISSVPPQTPTTFQAKAALPVSVVPQHSFDHPVFETLVLSPHLPDPSQGLLTEEVEVYPSEAPPPDQIASLLQSGLAPEQTVERIDGALLDRNTPDGRTVDRVVELNCAFEAIALALRHSAVVEVRSSLLQDEHFSYSLEELPSFFPKLVESGISAEEHGRFGADYDSRSEMERLQRRLFEAIRQGNNAKIDSIKRQLEFYSHIEGRSVLVLPPPHLFLAPDIATVNGEDRQLTEVSSVAGAVQAQGQVQVQVQGQSQGQSQYLPLQPVSVDAFEISSSEGTRPKGLFDGFALPFHFESQKKEQKELEEEQLDQMNISIASDEDDSQDDSQDDGLGQQLSSMFYDRR